MAWMAAAIGGSALLGAAASEAAAEKQLQGTREGIASTERMFNLTNQQQEPWRASGGMALGELNKLMGPSYGSSYLVDPTTGKTVMINNAMKAFSTEDFNKGIDPGYQFRLQQGQDLAKRQGNVGGGLVGGNVMKGLEDYTQQSASQEFMNAFNRSETGKQNVFNRLASIAGLGQTSVGQTTQAGTAAGNTLAALGVAGGNAAAGGYTGAASALTGGANSYANYQMMNQYMNRANPVDTSGFTGSGIGNVDYSLRT